MCIEKEMKKKEKYFLSHDLENTPRVVPSVISTPRPRRTVPLISGPSHPSRRGVSFSDRALQSRSRFGSRMVY